MLPSIGQPLSVNKPVTVERPLVSVCIPTYRDARFLAQSLDSIVSQTYSNMEIIVGDDASPDNTEEVVHSFQDPRMRYLRNRVNLGQFENVNHLVSQARGEYVAIYHSDDYYHPDIVLKEITFLRDHPDVGAVFALDWRVDDLGRTIGKMKLLPEIHPNSALGFAEIMSILLRHRNRVFRTPTFMCRAEVLKAVGPFRAEYEIVGDLEMWLRIAHQYPVAILDEYLMYYRRGSSQVSSSYERLRTHEDHFFVVMDQYLRLIPSTTAIDPLALLEYSYHRRADETVRALNCVRLGRLPEARELLNHSFPWQTLLVRTTDLGWRKVAVIVKRLLLKLGLVLSVARVSASLLS
ncbi:MAG: glycosyltransferase [Anaerolineales bacterium]|nr:glycosyltransferase [Anaerolineales bacterium]